MSTLLSRPWMVRFATNSIAVAKGTCVTQRNEVRAGHNHVAEPSRPAVATVEVLPRQREPSDHCHFRLDTFVTFFR